MPTEVLSPVLRQKFFGNDGNPLNGGKLFTYIAGTTTKQGTFRDANGAGANTNPVILDYRGEADVWIPPNVGFKFVLAPANDTDPPTNPLWTVDNVTNAQLLTLYGGTDTGVVNAYVLTFAASFTAYTDGIIIYFTPANTNTGASTLNVNGLGVVPIVNQDGSVLLGGQIVANQIVQVMYKGGNFLLLTYAISQGTFAPVWTGFSVAPVGNMTFQQTGRVVTLRWGGGQGTSNATSMTIQNLPIEIRPNSLGAFFGITATALIDNGALKLGAVGFTGLGVIQFTLGAVPITTGFTAAGTKGLDQNWSMTYARS